jgi:hypothetical protein
MKERSSCPLGKAPDFVWSPTDPQDANLEVKQALNEFNQI